MTTAELQAAFPSGRSRPSPWLPGVYAEWSRLRDESHAAERRATNIWAFYWWTHKFDEPGREAVVFQAVDLLQRISGLLMIEAAAVAGGR